MRVSINGTKKIMDLAGNEILDRTNTLKLAPFEYISASTRETKIHSIFR